MGVRIRIALAIVELFPNGGLQRDCIAISRRLSARGHQVKIVCTSAVGHEEDLNVVVLNNSAMTNHGRNQRFSDDLRRYVGTDFDVVAGFDALEGLDLLYCANPPVRYGTFLDGLNPRKRTFMKLEEACFGNESRTRLLLLSGVQREGYERRWHMDASRVTLVPPTIEKAQIVAPEARLDIRRKIRQTLGLAEGDEAWLFIGSFPKTKGLDRLISVLPNFPGHKLLCVGCSPKDAVRFKSLAERLGVHDQVLWLGVRSDVSDLMAGADLLVHPARHDVTGTVILEAVANGLPVVTTAVCGYAPHVILADAGIVIDEAFEEQQLIAALHRSSSTTLRTRWRDNALSYAKSVDLFGGLDVATEAIVHS